MACGKPNKNGDIILVPWQPVTLGKLHVILSKPAQFIQVSLSAYTSPFRGAKMIEECTRCKEERTPWRYEEALKGHICQECAVKLSARPAAKGADVGEHCPGIVHCRKNKFDVYVGRPTIWGNPFKIGFDGDRHEVIHKYSEWIKTQPGLMAKIPELRGKILACWCAPKFCHADILYDLANAVQSRRRKSE